MFCGTWTPCVLSLSQSSDMTCNLTSNLISVSNHFMMTDVNHQASHVPLSYQGRSERGTVLMSQVASLSLSALVCRPSVWRNGEAKFFFESQMSWFCETKQLLKFQGWRKQELHAFFPWSWPALNRRTKWALGPGALLGRSPDGSLLDL